MDKYKEEIESSRRAAAEFASPMLYDPKGVLEPEMQLVREPKETMELRRYSKHNAPEGWSDAVDVQLYLKENGYDIGNSGEYGDGVDGVIGPKTLKALSKMISKNRK